MPWSALKPFKNNQSTKTLEKRIKKDSESEIGRNLWEAERDKKQNEKNLSPQPGKETPENGNCEKLGAYPGGSAPVPHLQKPCWWEHIKIKEGNGILSLWG